jgi:hypothetical protein
MKHWWASLCDNGLSDMKRHIENAPCNRPLLSRLHVRFGIRFTIRFPANPYPISCKSLSDFLQIPIRFPANPYPISCKSLTDFLQIPIRFPANPYPISCKSLSDFLQILYPISCKSLSDFLQIPIRFPANPSPISCKSDGDTILCPTLKSSIYTDNLVASDSLSDLPSDSIPCCLFVSPGMCYTKFGASRSIF